MIYARCRNGFSDTIRSLTITNLLKCFTLLFACAFLAQSVFAQSDTPPSSRYIGPISHPPKALSPPASRYIGPFQKVVPVQRMVPDVTPPASRVISDKKIQPAHAFEQDPLGSRRVQQIQQLSDDSNQYFVPPVRTPLQAPNFAELHAFTPVQATSSETIDTDTETLPTMVAQAPPAMPEPLPVETSLPAKTSLPENVVSPVKLAPVMPSHPVQTNSTIPELVESEPIPLPPVNQELEKATERKQVQVTQASPVPTRAPVRTDTNPPSLPPMDSYYANDQQALPPALEPYQSASMDPYTEISAYEPQPYYQEYQASCDGSSPMFQQCNSPALAPFATFSFKGGNKRTLGNGRLFLPLLQDADSVLFADIRGQIDDNDASEGNWGLGYREFIDPNWIFGIYGYYDVLRSPNQNTFHQGTVGVELMSEVWDFRVNGYFPETGPKATTSNAAFVNGNIVVNNMAERAYGGFDAEIGRRILRWGMNDKFEVRWFGGGYHFENSAAGYGAFSGPRTRVEFRMYDLNLFGHQSRLEAGFEGSYDKVRKDQAFAFVRLRVPLSREAKRGKLNPLQRRLADLVVRDVDIVSQNAINSSEDAINPFTGQSYGDLLHLTAEDDYLSAIQNSQADAVILLDGSKGEFELQEMQSVVLKNGQTLLGGGYNMPVIGVETGNRVMLNSMGTRPTLRSLHEYIPSNNYPSISPASALPSPIIQIANQTTVSGLDIEAGGDSISGTSVTDVGISDVSINGSYAAGINLYDAKNVSIINTRISDTDRSGINLENFENVVINRAQVNNSVGAGVRANNGKNLSIVNSSISEVQSYSPVYLQGIAVENSNGIEIGSTKNTQVGGNYISGTMTGIKIYDSHGDIQISGNYLELGESESDFASDHGISIFSYNQKATAILVQNNRVAFEGDQYNTGISVNGFSNASNENALLSVKVLGNVLSGLNQQAFSVASNIDNSVLMAGNDFQFDDLIVDSYYNGVPMFSMNSQSGTTNFTMNDNLFRLTGGGVNDRPSMGDIRSQSENTTNIRMNNNTFPGETVKLFRDVNSEINILSNTNNDFTLELLENSQPITGVE